MHQLGGFTQLELEALWAILSGEEWSPERHQLEHVGEPSESTWLWRLPADFVARLAASTAAELPSVATKWAAIEELACSPDDVRPVLDALVALARSAGATKRGVYLWGSL